MTDILKFAEVADLADFANSRPAIPERIVDRQRYRTDGALVIAN